MANNNYRGLIPRVNFFDGQKVTESDMDSEQVYNRTVISGIVNDFHGSGIVWEDRFKERTLLDTSMPGSYSDGNDNLSKIVIESGNYDGMAISLDRGPIDTVMGSRVEVELSDSDVSGNNYAVVLIIGFAFDGIDEGGRLVSEFITFKENSVRLSNHYYLSINSVFFNNFSGGLGRTHVESEKKSVNNGGRIVIRETTPFSIYPQPIVSSQFGMPNVFFRDFITSSPSKIIEDEIKEAFGSTINFNELYFEIESESQLEFRKDGSSSVAYGQKFLFESNNLQKISILLSVENDEDADIGEEYNFSGDIVLSIYELATDTNCPTDVIPDNLIDFDPELNSIMELSYSMHDLEDLGYRLNNVSSIVDFNFAGTLIADPVIEPSLESGKYYAFMVTRRGDNRVGTVIMEKGFDPVARKNDNSQTLSKLEQFGMQKTRFVEFDPSTSRYVDDYRKSLWFAIHSDTVEVTSGLAYSEDGFLIALPKTEEYIGNSQISRFERNIPLVDVAEGAKNYILLSNSSKYLDPDVHPRTGNFVYTRILDSAAISVVSEDDLDELLDDIEPIILAKVSDKNVREFSDISGTFSIAGLYDRNSIYIIDPDNDLLESNLVNMIITPDLDCECTNKYRITRTECYYAMSGDLDSDGELTLQDVYTMLDYVGSTINSETTERKLLGGELDIVSFIKADLNDDETIDGLDIELLEDAIDGYVNFSIEERFRVLKISVENILSEDNYPVLFLDEDLTSYSSIDESTIGFISSSEEIALAIRIGDIVIVPPESGDAGSYIIDGKTIGDDGISVLLSVTDLDGNSVVFSGSLGFNIEIISGTRTNMLADNSRLLSVPYEDKNFSISFIDAAFEGRFIDICDLRRYVESTFIEESDYGLCKCEEPECQTPEICSPQYKNQYIVPNDLYIPNGEIYSSPGIPYHGDFEYSKIRIPMPPGTIEDCQINLYETFIKSKDEECLTAAGYPAMKYSDGTYVGCEDVGSDTDISKGRVKISEAIASLYVDSFIDGYAAEDGYEEHLESTSFSLLEMINESFEDKSYDSFETWPLNVFSDASVVTVSAPTGPNEPAVFSIFTTPDVPPKFGRIDVSSSPDIDASGDFVLDFNAYRSVWPGESLSSGVLSSYMLVEIDNADGTTSEISFGWREEAGLGTKLFYSGKMYDSSGALTSVFDYEVDAEDALGDEVMFRIRRIDDVCTAMYFNPSNIDLVNNPDGQYMRVGENPSAHPGGGDARISYRLEQDRSPPSSLSFSTSLVNVYIESSYSSEIASDEYVEISKDSFDNVKQTTVSFPLNLPKKTSVVAAYIRLNSYGATSTTDLFNIIPITSIHADNLGIFYNYAKTQNDSIIASFRPGIAADSEEILVDVTSTVIASLAEPGHLPGYVKAFIIEPDDSATTSFSFYSDSIELVVEYLDMTTGVIFKVGVSLDPTTGIASFKTKNVLYDVMIEENRTVIEFGVFLKKSGFINSDISIGLQELSRIGIGTCTDDDELLADDECFFIAGNTATGTFVEGPFPCAFHLPQYALSSAGLAGLVQISTSSHAPTSGHAPTSTSSSSATTSGSSSPPPSHGPPPAPSSGALPAGAGQYLHGKWKVTGHDSIAAGLPAPPGAAPGVGVNFMLSIDENLWTYFEEFDAAGDGAFVPCNYDGSISAGPLTVNYTSTSTPVIEGDFSHAGTPATSVYGPDGPPRDCHADDFDPWAGGLAALIGVNNLGHTASPFSPLTFEINTGHTPWILIITTQPVGGDFATGVYNRITLERESDTPDVIVATP